MYEKILVPLDGSEVAERVLPHVETLARRLNSEVILLTACGPGQGPEHLFRTYVEKRAEALHSLGIRARSAVVRGEVASEIIRFAEEEDIALIVFSTHGQSGPGVWAMGNVANKISQRSRIPMLLIRSTTEPVDAERDLRKVLVPLDGSKFAEQVLPHVEGLAVAMGSEVVLLEVLETVEVPGFAAYEVGPDWQEFKKGLMARAETRANRYLRRKGNALGLSGVSARSVVLWGRPAETILQYAEDNSVNLIALATHGFTGISRWAYGSVAYKVMMASSKPVLVVRPPSPKSDAQRTHR